MIHGFQSVVLLMSLGLYLHATCVNTSNVINEIKVQDINENGLMPIEIGELLDKTHEKSVRKNYERSDIEHFPEENIVADVGSSGIKQSSVLPNLVDKLHYETKQVHRYRRTLGSSRSSSRSRTRTRKNRHRHSGGSDDDHTNDSTDNHQSGDTPEVPHSSGGQGQSGSSGTIGNTDVGTGTTSKKQPKPQKVTSILSKILDVYKVDSLEKVSIEGVNIFKNIVFGQKNFLKTRLQNLDRLNYDVEDVVRTVDGVFKKINNQNDVNFKNFLNIVEFTATYMSEKVDRLNDLYNDKPQSLAGFVDVESIKDLTVQVRLREFAKLVSSRLSESHHSGLPVDVSLDGLAGEIASIKRQVEGISMNGDPGFRDPYSAAYHYYKHRQFRAKNRILSVDEYYDALKADLDEVKKTDDYQKLLRHEIVEVNVERYRPEFDKKTKLVLKLQNDQVNVAAFYIIE